MTLDAGQARELAGQYTGGAAYIARRGLSEQLVAIPTPATVAVSPRPGLRLLAVTERFRCKARFTAAQCSAGRTHFRPRPAVVWPAPLSAGLFR